MKLRKTILPWICTELHIFQLSLILGWFSTIGTFSIIAIYPTFNCHTLAYLSYAYLHKSR